MKPMEHSTTGRPTGTVLGDTSIGTTDQGPGTPHYTRHFQSLILPSLVSVPPCLRGCAGSSTAQTQTAEGPALRGRTSIHPRCHQATPCR